MAVSKKIDAAMALIEEIVEKKIEKIDLFRIFRDEQLRDTIMGDLQTPFVDELMYYIEPLVRKMNSFNENITCEKFIELYEQEITKIARLIINGVSFYTIVTKKQ